jgi:uncharacterized coiled-coil protein SlyX
MTLEGPITPSSQANGFARFIVRALRVILRLIVVLLVGIGLGVGAYLGIPALYRQYIEPVQVNTQRLVDLEQAFQQAQADARQDRTTWNERLAAVEARLAAQAEAVAALQADIAQQGQDLDDLSSLPRRVADLAGDLEDTTTRVADLEASLAAADSPTQRLGRQLQLIRAMELLTRARLWLTQGNAGLASQDITSARTLLAGLLAAAPEEEAAALEAIIARLDLALEDLTTSPVVAADDLEIAWQLLFAATEP